MPIGWLLVAALSCGGKTVGDGSPGAAGATIADGSAATDVHCHLRSTGLALLGITERHLRERLRVYEELYAKCPRELDRFLKCMGTTHVECTPGEVVIIDCSDERVDLQHCGQ